MLGGLVQAVHGLASLDDLWGRDPGDRRRGGRLPRLPALIEERALACGAVLVVEGAADGGGVKTGRKGCGTFEVAVTGRASHAGLEPAAGVNALVEAAHQVLAIAELGRPEVGTTVTPTVASAGTLDNVVPAAATVVVDVRVESAEEKERIESAFAALAPRLDEAVITVRGEASAGRRCPSRRRPGCSRWRNGCSPVSKAGRSGGGSDGNFTAALGVPTLDGLGAVGGGAHADHEYLVVASMSERARLVAGLVDAIRALDTGHDRSVRWASTGRRRAILDHAGNVP